MQKLCVELRRFRKDFDPKSSAQQRPLAHKLRNTTEVPTPTIKASSATHIVQLRHYAL